MGQFLVNWTTTAHSPVAAALPCQFAVCNSKTLRLRSNMPSKCHCGKNAKSFFKSIDGNQHCSMTCLEMKGRVRSEEAIAKHVSLDGSGLIVLLIPTHRARRRDGAASDDDDDNNNERGSLIVTVILFACSKRSRTMTSSMPRPPRLYWRKRLPSMLSIGKEVLALTPSS